MKNVAFLCFSVFVLSFVVGCKNKGCDQQGSVDVYVAGSIKKNQWIDVATVWKNGEVMTPALTDGMQNSYATSVFVSGGDVYAAGYESTFDHNHHMAKVWKNGVEMIPALTDGTKDSEAYSVFVSGGNVYVAGYEYDDRGAVAKIWRNGVEMIPALSDGMLNTYALSVFVFGGDVYVAGYEEDNLDRVAKAWKNGVAMTLALTEDGTKWTDASSVFVSDGDVYVAGRENAAAVVWKNGVATLFPAMSVSRNTSAFSVFVSGKDVYVAGYEEDNIIYDYNPNASAKVWKNGIATTILPGSGMLSSYAHSVFVSCGNVYVEGYEFSGDYDSSSSRVWRNGETIFPVTNNIRTSSVFVVKR